MKQRSWRWQQASAEEQREAVPVDLMLVMDLVRHSGHIDCTYRALELGPFASSALNNIVQADLCIANVFALGLARDRAGRSVPTAVSIHAIAVIVCEAPMCAGSTALKA